MRHGAGRRGAAVVAAVVLTMLATPAAVAQTDPEVSQLINDLAAVRRDIEVTNAQLMSNREQQVVLAGHVNDLVSRIGDLKAQITSTQSEIDALVAQREAILKVVRARAARLYVARQPTSPLAEFITSAPMQLARRRALGEAVAQRDEAERSVLKDASDKLAAARDELASQRDALQGQEADLEQQQRTLADLDAQVQSQQAQLDARAKDLQARLQAAIALGVIRAGGVSLMGPTNLSAAQMAGWWRTQHYTANIATSVDAMAQLYVDEGNAEGVRGDVAFAQAVLETGGFRSAPGNNFAGMGWCDSCTQGRVFPTPLDGVRAQIQHLRNYGDPTSRASGLHHPASVYWYAPASLDQSVADTNFDAFFAKGWALTWNQMGHGNWATDPRYSDKVMKIYAAMVAYAQSG